MVEKSLSCEKHCVLFFVIEEFLIHIISGPRLFFLGQCPAGAVQQQRSRICSSHPAPSPQIQLEERRTGTRWGGRVSWVYRVFSADSDLARNTSPHPNTMGRTCSQGSVPEPNGTGLR